MRRPTGALPSRRPPPPTAAAGPRSAPVLPPPRPAAARGPGVGASLPAACCLLAAGLFPSSRLPSAGPATLEHPAGRPDSALRPDTGELRSAAGSASHRSPSESGAAARRGGRLLPACPRLLCTVCAGRPGRMRVVEGPSSSLCRCPVQHAGQAPPGRPCAWATRCKFTTVRPVVILL